MAKITIKPKTARERKAEVLKWTGWDTTKYNKEYDKFRNRVRTYEKIIGETKKENVAYIFHDYIYHEKFNQYQTSKVRAILATPSLSSGAKIAPPSFEEIKKQVNLLGDAAPTQPGKIGRRLSIASEVLGSFRALANRMPTATKKILDNAENTDEALKALAKLADEIHDKQRKDRKKVKDGDAFDSEYYEN